MLSDVELPVTGALVVMLMFAAVPLAWIAVGSMYDHFFVPGRGSLYQKLLPMCCVCKKIRDDRQAKPGGGQWVEVEQFIHDKANLDITSSYCPDCARQTMEAFTNRKAGQTKK